MVHVSVSRGVHILAIAVYPREKFEVPQWAANLTRFLHFGDAVLKYLVYYVSIPSVLHL